MIKLPTVFTNLGAPMPPDYPPDISSMPNESDVEQKFITPLLSHSSLLNLDSAWIKSKTYLPARDLGKGSKRAVGYYPDFSIWIDGLPLAVIEAKGPGESAERGFYEAQLYALELNGQFPTDFNPVSIVISTNGVELIVGSWDCKTPELRCSVQDLAQGSEVFASLLELSGRTTLTRRALKLHEQQQKTRFWKPINFIGGQKRLAEELPFNSFAVELAPILQRYFESEEPEALQEILKEAYVSSDQTTRYERVFETYLRDKIPEQSTKGIKTLAPKRSSEPAVAEVLRSYSNELPTKGRTQILLGHVGSGKTTFIKRYFYHLQPSDIQDRTFWSFLDFNTAPDNLDELEEWVCEKFVEGLEINNKLPNLYEHDRLLAIFSTEINKLKGAYKYLRENSPDQYQARLAEDLSNWLQDKKLFAKSIARHLIGDTAHGIVVVFDNVDRRDREQQLRIFQACEWFKSETRSFCVISLREETYKQYKDEPPLDAFQNAVHFYIPPPRFADMVRRRLELAIRYLCTKTTKILHYQTGDGLSLSYPATNLGHYLRSVYVDLFRSHRKVTWVLEGLTGRDVRKALEMFTRILISGHLNETLLTKTILSGGVYNIPEHLVIKILMRTNYVFFHDDAGFITNLFDFLEEAKWPNNFTLIEILYFLNRHRKKPGDIRIEGYVRVSKIQHQLSRAGFPPEDVLSALKFLVRRGLVTADHLSRKDLHETDCVRIHASGYIHIRLLIERLEYHSGCALVTRMHDRDLAESLSKFWNISGYRRDISVAAKERSSRIFLEYLKKQRRELTNCNPFFDEVCTGSLYAIEAIERSLDFKGGRSNSSDLFHRFSR